MHWLYRNRCAMRGDGHRSSTAYNRSEPYRATSSAAYFRCKAEVLCDALNIAQSMRPSRTTGIQP